ncbi:hypothetical protein QJS10_CPA07g00558 [Acorus calamus]|uniref:Transposase MuDR plant domain-containing protein n=1 Tax=Acorus calamus TaxID=4465 RepID=A0AAV9EEN6_ACOCL|nr:hypothetical protein QJS10_CPA07g00558 [Acorus calamus]
MDDTIYKKQVNSANGQKYVEGRQFTQLLDADKIALIDLWEDIGPWSKTNDGIEELTVHDELYGEEEERHLDNNKEDDSELEEHSELEDGDCDGVFDEHTVEENEDQQKQDPLEEVGEQHSGSYSDREVLSDACEGEFIEIDNEKPKMIVGSRFPSVFHFRDALKQHCIINKFAVKYIKNDLLRVTAKCKVEKCTWRIHSSVLQDGVTFENLSRLGLIKLGVTNCGVGGHNQTQDYGENESSSKLRERMEGEAGSKGIQTVRPRGRPKRNRIRDPNEKNKRRHMCTRCKEYGHHISTCKNPISNDSQGSGTVGRGSARGRGRGHGRGRGSLSVVATSRRGRSLRVRPSRRGIYKATRERPKIPTNRGGKAIQGPWDISETE